jgi:hypothetical protein
MIANNDLAENLGPRSNEDMIPDTRSTAPATQISQGDAMIEGTPGPYNGLRVHDNATKVMDTQPRSYLCLSRNRNPGDDLNTTLHEEAQWLSRETVLVAPAKETVDQQCLEALRQQPAYEGPQPGIFFSQAGDIGLHSTPQWHWHCLVISTHIQA